ncbi:alkaline phosphatase synthesis sensor protein PhoR [Peptococcaceae bacterium CEB3]|nr:alkaline phosphatase synthesis sensor protein PhoR [Peptococcaceae bacterium CEB3]
MFRKLRNRFLILNMSITSLMMLVAFAAIYFLTYSNTQAEIQKTLNPSSGMVLSIKGPDLPKEPNKEIGSTAQVFSGDSSLFEIDVDAHGKILNINSSLGLSDEEYKKAAETAWNNKQGGSITLEGRQWQYAISQMKEQVIQANGQQYTVTENQYRIMYLDVTESYKSLFELLARLIIVGSFMLIVIFVISLYFANRAIKPITETWEKQKQFIANASHELKTPLSIINANYDALLVNQEETIKSQMKWLDYIKIGTDRMTKLINDLLSLAKVEDANFAEDKIPFNMSDAINDVILSMEALMIEKGIKLSQSIEPDIIIKSDSERVKRVVTILFENAVKYTNEKGQIAISLIKSKHQVIYSIKNSGKGIAKEDLPKVFDRFYRADPSRTHDRGSYGLGLSIAKTIINNLGGEINVSSVENEYTTFTFTLGL